MTDEHDGESIEWARPTALPGTELLLATLRACLAHAIPLRRRVQLLSWHDSAPSA